MSLEAIPYTIPLFLSTTIMMVILFVVWRDRRDEPRARVGCFLISGCAIWMFAYAMEILCVKPVAMIFWDKVKYLGVATTPTAFFVYILYYTGWRRFLTRGVVLLLAIVPIITFSLALTQEFHGILYSSLRTEYVQGLSLVKRELGPWVKGYIYYSYLLISAAFVVAIRTFSGQRKLYKRQLWVVFLAAIVIALAQMRGNFGPPALRILDMRPFMIAFVTPFIAWGFFRLRLGDIMPLAHSVIIDTIMDPVFVVDAQSRLIDVNPAARKLMGRGKTEIIGRSIQSVWPKWPLADSASGQPGETVAEIEFPAKSRSRIFDAKISPLYDAQQQVISRIVVLRDITERKRFEVERKKAYEELQQTQSQLIQSAKLASIGELASGVAHELNQPLMVIRSNAQYLLHRLGRQALTSEELQKQLRYIEKNSGRMMSIINHLRVFSRQPGMELQAVDINTVLDDALLMVEEQLRVHDINVSKQLDYRRPIISGNKNQIEQVFLNLITNARDAILAKRESHTGVSKTDMIEFTTRPATAGKHLIEILIRDTGGGIPGDKQEAIFDPFFTTKEVGKGTGLGLSISYGIVQSHKGEIDVAQTGPEGTTFSIRLPVRIEKQG